MIMTLCIIVGLAIVAAALWPAWRPAAPRAQSPAPLLLRHAHERENARRRRQLARGTIRESGCADLPTIALTAGACAALAYLWTLVAPVVQIMFPTFP